jgi:3-dehydroquinate synthase
LRLSPRLGLCAAADGERVASHLAAHGLPTEAAGLPAEARRAAALMRHMRHDKKMKDGRLRLVLARGIGGAFIAEDVGDADIAAALDEFLGSADSP